MVKLTESQFELCKTAVDVTINVWRDTKVDGEALPQAFIDEHIQTWESLARELGEK